MSTAPQLPVASDKLRSLAIHGNSFQVDQSMLNSWSAVRELSISSDQSQLFRALVIQCSPSLGGSAVVRLPVELSKALPDLSTLFIVTDGSERREPTARVSIRERLLRSFSAYSGPQGVITLIPQEVN